MERLFSDPPANSPEPSRLLNIDASYRKIQDLLRTKDDTSRFVGLAILKTVLDNGQLAQDPGSVRILWEALSTKFLDRLLRAHQSAKLGKSEARDMVDIAVAVLHTFSILLPEDSRKQARLVGRTSALVGALVESPPETTELILQTLSTISSQSEGAVELLRLEDLSPLTEIATQYPIVLDIIGFMWTTASTIDTEVSTVQRSIARIMPNLLNVFRGTDAVTLIAFTGSVLSRIIPQGLPQSPIWLEKLICALRKLVVIKPTQTSRAAYTQLASTLLQAYPTETPNLLFKDDTISKAETKPFSYLFIDLLLIDIRSSFPSLLAQLNSSHYPHTSERLAAAFDVLSSFIAFLVNSLDDESSTVSIAPDLLLKLRKDIAETMSLTIEYLRDRWDASIAGTSGLHPSARTGTVATAESTRLALAWESMKDNVNSDPLVLAAVRTLAVWIREDENENLRDEMAGLMDMLLELYKMSSTEALDFRYPILLALEGILISGDGIDKFLELEGWQVIVQDLENVIRIVVNQPKLDTHLQTSRAARGLQIIRVALTVIDHPSTSFPREDWMASIALAASMRVTIPPGVSITLELQIAMLQLSTALLSNAAEGMRKRYVTNIAALSGLVKQLRRAVETMNDKPEAIEFMELLEDVALNLENLRLSG